MFAFMKPFLSFVEETSFGFDFTHSLEVPLDWCDTITIGLVVVAGALGTRRRWYSGIACLLVALAGTYHSLNRQNVPEPDFFPSVDTLCWSRKIAVLFALFRSCVPAMEVALGVKKDKFGKLSTIHEEEVDVIAEALEEDSRLSVLSRAFSSIATAVDATESIFDPIANPASRMSRYVSEWAQDTTGIRLSPPTKSVGQTIRKRQVGKMAKLSAKGFDVSTIQK